MFMSNRSGQIFEQKQDLTNLALHQFFVSTALNVKTNYWFRIRASQVETPIAEDLFVDALGIFGA
jgi:hypothetical protein